MIHIVKLDIGCATYCRVLVNKRQLLAVIEVFHQEYMEKSAAYVDGMSFAKSLLH